MTLTKRQARSLAVRAAAIWRLRLDRVGKAEATSALKAAQPIWSTTAVPTQQDFINLVRASRRDLLAIAQLLAAGEIDAREWAERFKQILNRDHARSWALGRQRAGDTLPFGIDDALRGVAAADMEADFLLSFLEAIQSGDKRYWDDDGKLRVDQVARRSRMYTGAYGGSANHAFAASVPDEAEIYWRLGGTENHCADCPEIAVLSPFTKDTLWTVPKGNETPCLFQCLCWLETFDADGNSMTGFKPIR
jgi:hypothetical protein